MNIVADMSLYPLKDGPIPTIISFIREMQQQDGIEIVTNQLSTQVSGEFEAVTGRTVVRHGGLRLREVADVVTERRDRRVRPRRRLSRHRGPGRPCAPGRDPHHRERGGRA